MSAKQSSHKLSLLLLCCVLSLGLGGAWAVAARSGNAQGARTPPPPRIHSRPSKRTDVRWALFTVDDHQRGVTYQCSIDGSPFRSCKARVLYGLVETTVRSRASCTARGRPRRNKHGPPKNCRRHTAKRSGRSRARSRSRSVLRGAGRLLALGRHTFRVRARGHTGRLSHVATYTWMVLTKAQLEALEHPTGGSSGSAGGTTGSAAGSAGSGTTGSEGTAGEGGGSTPSTRAKSFLISGEPEGTLYPGGPALEIPLTVFNPNPTQIVVTALAVGVASSPAGCSATENLQITQAGVSAASPLVVPANGSVTLPVQGDPAPMIRFLDLEVNQDACKGATFPLVYSGSAHS